MGYKIEDNKQKANSQTHTTVWQLPEKKKGEGG